MEIEAVELLVRGGKEESVQFALPSIDCSIWLVVVAFGREMDTMDERTDRFMYLYDCTHSPCYLRMKYWTLFLLLIESGCVSIGTMSLLERKAYSELLHMTDL